MGYSGARGTLIYEKNLKAKISCQAPFKGSPEYVAWNVLYHTSFRNYASFSLQVPSILSILLGWHYGHWLNMSKIYPYTIY